jgi:hypothetical protein
LLTAAVAESAVLVALWATLFGLDALCGVEYTPGSRTGSPRDLACADPGLRHLLLWASPFLVPLSALGLWRRSPSVARTLVIMASLTLVAVACLYAYARLIGSESPTR